MKRTTLICMRHARPTQGFSLVEVLVSMLVLTVGLIGAAMMQLHAFRTTEQSNFHDTAVTLARQIADEIRANNVEMSKASGPNQFIPLTYSAAASNPGATPANCYSGACNAAAMAGQNIVEWKRRIEEVLPDGRLEICRETTPVAANGDFVWCGAGGAPASGPITIKVGWSARTPDGKGTTGIQPPQVALLVTPLSQ